MAKVIDSATGDGTTNYWAHDGTASGEPSTYITLTVDNSLFNVLLTTCHVVWVKTSPEEHMQRVIDQGDMRPIESNDDAMADLRRILEAREPFYAQSHAVIDTAGTRLETSFEQLIASLSKKCIEYGTTVQPGHGK